MPEQHKVVFLTDGVVILRPVLRSDIPFALSCVNDPGVRCFISSYLPMLEEDEEKWVKRLHEQKETNIVFAIEVDEKTIGFMGLHNIKWKDRVAVTGAMIKEKENRGKGYGTRAKMLMLHYAFYECNLRKICSHALAFNGASIGFNEKCGYKEEAVLKKHIWNNGEYVDLVQSAVFLEDFVPLWEEHKKKYGIVL